jgi:hypothetical protein
MRTCFIIVLIASLCGAWLMPKQADRDDASPVIARYQPPHDSSLYAAGFRATLPSAPAAEPQPLQRPSLASQAPSPSYADYVAPRRDAIAASQAFYSTGQQLRLARQKELDEAFAVMREPGV